MQLPKNLSNQIYNRNESNSLRNLSHKQFKIDFFSNDYLGYSGNTTIKKNYTRIIEDYKIDKLGSTGSRLISGNHQLFEILEDKAKNILNAEAALFFNSGYDANIGLLSAILKPKDIIFYDELCHASIRDGLQMSPSKSYKFKHNDYQDLISKIEIQQNRLNPQNIYIISESVFSMDGDVSDIAQLVGISKRYQAYLIIDEAHALGVCGQDFKGLTIEHAQNIFARIYTCGKSLGNHGGFVLGSTELKNFLVNFSRPFIYTTGASPHHVAMNIAALNYFENHQDEKQQLQENISIFADRVNQKYFSEFISSNHSAIQTIGISGNTKAKRFAKQLQDKGFGVKAILSPTVPKGHERIRICLHSFNNENEIEKLFLVVKSILQ